MVFINLALGYYYSDTLTLSFNDKGIEKIILAKLDLDLYSPNIMFSCRSKLQNTEYSLYEPTLLVAIWKLTRYKWSKYLALAFEDIILSTTWNFMKKCFWKLFPRLKRGWDCSLVPQNLKILKYRFICQQCQSC